MGLVWSLSDMTKLKQGFSVQGTLCSLVSTNTMQVQVLDSLSRVIEASLVPLHKPPDLNHKGLNDSPCRAVLSST
ncbi:hypothetical protein V6N13_055617 [Hibiscus sabdariffa]|uniref:Uncharacterized protein n=1 Tax=Hibiscus sabdariffa TaxID=183260 RepID=A0ABR2BMN2_9ROSI